MRRPVSEHDTTIRSRRRTTPTPDPHSGAPMEPVSGGRVRRIVFPGEAPRPEPARREEAPPEPAPPPRRRYRRPADMAEIEADVDRIIGRRRTGYRTASREHVQERVVYETPRGAVRATEVATPEGRRKAIYLSRREGEAEKERRFLVSEVDKVIADVPGRRGRTVPDAVPEPLPKGQAPAREHEKPKRTGKRRRSARRGPQARGPPRIVEPEEAEALETTHEEGTAAGGPVYRPQCVALTKDGMQCRNSSRKGSQYCSAHKGYRPPTQAEWEKRMDTAPRVAKAKDTKPALKRTASTAKRSSGSAKASRRGAAKGKGAGRSTAGAARKTARKPGPRKAAKAPKKTARKAARKTGGTTGAKTGAKTGRKTAGGARSTATKAATKASAGRTGRKRTAGAAKATGKAARPAKKTTASAKAGAKKAPKKAAKKSVKKSAKKTSRKAARKSS